jgi:LemA protein
MNVGLILGIGIPTVVVLVGGSYVYKTYNRLINLRIDVERQTSHVQVHLKKKFDLIPALAEVVKGYASHEKDTFEEVTRLRSQWGKATNSDEKMQTANILEGALSKLLVVQERYPKLKADKSFQNIQKSIGWVERELVRERKLYNRRVSSYNVKLQEFPSNIIGKIFGFKEKEFFGKPDASLE